MQQAADREGEGVEGSGQQAAGSRENVADGNTKLPTASRPLPTTYPLRITWSGIIVDDEDHPDDIVTRVREAMTVIWKDKAGDIEQEACEILKVKTLRDYFSRPSNFFADHLKRYSKSRRQAPIYWPLSSENGSARWSLPSR